jgi:hypothetical protein
VRPNHEPENFRDQLQTVKEINRVVFPQAQGAQTRATAHPAVIIVPDPDSDEGRALEARRRVIEAQVLGDKYEQEGGCLMPRSTSGTNLPSTSSAGLGRPVGHTTAQDQMFSVRLATG